MGTDALLSAILSGVLRPSAQASEFGRAAVTVADIEEVRDGDMTEVCQTLLDSEGEKRFTCPSARCEATRGRSGSRFSLSFVFHDIYIVT